MASVPSSFASTRRAPVDAARQDELLAIIIRNPTAFDAVYTLLSVRSASAISPAHGFLWRIVREFVDVHGQMPSRSNLTSNLSQAQANDQALDAVEAARLDDLIAYAWDDAEHGEDMPQSAIATATALQICRDYLMDLQVYSVRDQITRDNQIPIDLPTLLTNALQEASQVDALTQPNLGEPFPEDWDVRTRIPLFTTGIPMIDELLGGGWRGGEVILLMAPYGACKTTAACHGVAGLIRRAVEMVAHGNVRLAPDGSPMRPVVMLAFTESDLDEYRVRIMSNLAQVPWATLAEMTSVSSLSGEAEPGATPTTQYEIELFHQQDPAGFLSEQERVRTYRTVANQHLVLLDCTADPESKSKLGLGGVQQIAAAVKNYFKQHPEAYPVALFLDHASALADRMAEAMGDAGEKALPNILKRIPRQMRDHIAAPMDIPVMLFHQFSGEANAWSPKRRLHHAHAAGSKSIGEYVNFAIMAYPPDRDGLCRMDLTKHRRRPATDQRFARIRGQFNTIDDVTPYFVYDAARGRIVSKAEFQANTRTAQASRALGAGSTHTSIIEGAGDGT